MSVSDHQINTCPLSSFKKRPLRQVYTALIVLDHTHTGTVTGLGGSCGKRHKPVAALELSGNPSRIPTQLLQPQSKKRGIPRNQETRTNTRVHHYSKPTSYSITYAILFARKRCLVRRKSPECALVFNCFAVFPKEKARQH